ncbi:MAG: hypothetical protein HYW63_03010 [Candidatus Levybacteria bacterium]|nr:hypothetical protein [Candidatus Levybacteria bacterium]
MKTTIERTADGTIELKITIPWAIVKKERDIVLAEMVKNANLPGFRKGKAPKKLVEEKLDNARVKDEVLRQILPGAYTEAIKEYNLKPIMDPRIHVEGELLEGKDWQFHAITSEAPEVRLDGYKEEVKKVTAKSKIIVPGKQEEKPKLDEIIKALLANAEITIPKVLIDREVDRLLSQTLDEIKRLGMSLDQYLSSTGKTAEALRAEYAGKAEADLKLEFALQKVAQEEKITVEEAEIEKTIENAKPEERESLRANRYLLASILRQQKTLDFLRNL